EGAGGAGQDHQERAEKAVSHRRVSPNPKSAGGRHELSRGPEAAPPGDRPPVCYRAPAYPFSSESAGPAPSAAFARLVKPAPADGGCAGCAGKEAPSSASG